MMHKLLPMQFERHIYVTMETVANLDSTCSWQYQILIHRSGLAERYNVA